MLRNLVKMQCIVYLFNVHVVLKDFLKGKDNASVLPPNYFVVRLKREWIGKLHELQIEVMVGSKLKRFNCPLCHLTFSKKSSLNRHVKIHTGEKPHTCPTCQEGFTRADKLKVHIQRMHEEYYQATWRKNEITYQSSSQVRIFAENVNMA